VGYESMLQTGAANTDLYQSGSANLEPAVLSCAGTAIDGLALPSVCTVAGMAAPAVTILAQPTPH